MALSTTKITLSPNEWTLLAEDNTSVLCQVRGSLPVEIWGGVGTPDSDDVGVTLTGEAGSDSVIFADLTTEKIYGRPLISSSASVVVVKT